MLWPINKRTLGPTRLTVFCIQDGMVHVPLRRFEKKQKQKQTKKKKTLSVSLCLWA